MITWLMVIISITTGEINARIPYQTFHDCLSKVPIAYRGNAPGTVKIVCEPAMGV